MRPILALLLVCLVLSCTTILRSREEVRMAEDAVAMTFDDGPSETEFVDDQILDLLKEKKIRACFCLITGKLRGKSEVLRRMITEGHIIAFHSRNHELYLTKSYAQFQIDVAEFENTLHEETGLDYKVRFVRPPVGVISTSLVNEMESRGLKLVYSTHNPTDTFVNAQASGEYIDRLLAEFRSRRGGIVVFHTGSELFPRPTARDFANAEAPAKRSWVPAAVGHFIEVLSEKGFRFVGVDEIGS